MPIDQEHLLRHLLRDRSKLLAYIGAIVPDAHLAEDIFQDISLLAVRKQAEIEGELHLPAWLRQAARNSALQARRNLARRRTLLLDGAALDALERHWAARDADNQAERKEALKACIERLAPYSRQLVELRYGDGISGAALGQRVGRKVQTVYVALSRAHRALAECMTRSLSSGGAAHV